MLLIHPTPEGADLLDLVILRAFAPLREKILDESPLSSATLLLLYV
jgi:hypothetical protein